MGRLFLYYISMKQKFYEQINKSEYLQEIPLITLARVAVEFATLGMIKEDYCDVSELYEHALYGGKSVSER